MDLSPNDIRNYEFSTQMRGYSKDEVESLLEQVAAALEAVKQDNLKLSMEADSLKTQLAGLRQFEDTIKSAAIDARRNADMTISNAKQEAELTLSKAKAESDKILGSRAQQLSEIETSISTAEMTKRSYLNKVRSIITSHLDIIDQLIGSEAGDKESNDIEVTQSSEVDRKKMETVGTPSPSGEPIRTEEANAAERIVEAPSEPESESKATGSDDEQSDSADDETKPIDPELAAALERYQTQEADAADSDVTEVPEEPHPEPGQIVETTARAEDIPPGFIVEPRGNSETSEPGDEVATDRLAVDGEPPARTVDDPIDGDAPPPASSNPEDLAQELERVVAKFEEEMDKAAKA